MQSAETSMSSTCAAAAHIHLRTRRSNTEFGGSERGTKSVKRGHRGATESRDARGTTRLGAPSSDEDDTTILRTYID